MRIFKIFIFVFALTSAFSAYGAKLKIGVDELLLLSAGGSSEISHYIVDKNNLSAVPSWDGAGDPPLANKAVTSLVLKKHKETHGNIESTIRKVSLSSKRTSCSAKQECPETLWYYKVKVRGEKRATYVVLINGDLVEPRVNKY